MRGEQERTRQRGNEEGIHFLSFLRYYRCGLTAKVDKPGVKGWVPAAQRGKGCVLPIKPGKGGGKRERVSVYHVALAGRVQRYSPIYYPDSHANSAIVPAGLRLTERPSCCHTVVAATRVVVLTHTPTHRYVSSSRQIQRGLSA